MPLYPLHFFPEKQQSSPTACLLRSLRRVTTHLCISFSSFIKWDNMTNLARSLWRFNNSMCQKWLASRKPSENGICYHHQIEDIKRANIPPKSPFGETEIYSTQQTKVCQVLQVPVLMNKWKCLVMSIMIVLWKWHSRGACKQFLVSRKHCPWELVYNTNLLLQLSLPGLHGKPLAEVWENQDKSIFLWGLWSQGWSMGSQEPLEWSSTFKEIFLSFFLLSSSWSKLSWVIFDRVNIWKGVKLMSLGQIK